MTDENQPLRIGILGLASISRKNVIAILHESSGCVVTALASRGVEKAEKFVTDIIQPSKSSKSTRDVLIFSGDTAYDELVNSNGVVDALYIPLPTSMRKEWIVKALRAGKHVLLEKPVALSVADFNDILTEAYRHNKFIMDGTMFPHHNRTSDVLKAVSDSEIFGSVHRIQSSFTFLGDDDFFAHDIRVQKDGDPLGCIGDLGWYCVCFALLVYGTLGSKVESVRTLDYKLTPDGGVPIDATCLVRFHDGRVLQFHCGFFSPFRQHVEVCGTKKCLLMDDYVLPTQAPNSYTLYSSYLTDHDCVTIQEKEQVASPVFPVQEVRMWETFARICRGLQIDDGSNETGWRGDTECIKEGQTLALLSRDTQLVMDSLIESIAQGGGDIVLS